MKLFRRENYILMGLSLGLVVLGLVLMSGGGSIQSMEFSQEIFSTRRVVIAPIVMTMGFLVMIPAILYRGRRRDR